MSNLKQWLLKAANGEIIEAVMLGELPDKGGKLGNLPWDESKLKSSQVLTWAEAEQLIDRDTTCAAGHPALKAITAWTKSRVIFISQQHGATSIEYAPRRPSTHRPKDSET